MPRQVRPGSRSRRALLAPIVALALAAPSATGARTSPAPTLVFHHGTVLTMDTRQPRAQAVAVRGSTIVAVGSNRAVLRLRGPGTRVVNLRGRTLAPGFVDAHMHLLNETERISFDDAQRLALSNGVTSYADMFTPPEVLASVRAAARAGRLRVRTSLYLLYNTNCGVRLGGWYLHERPISNPRAMLRIPGVKVFADGGSCGRPAVSWPYPNGGGTGDLWIGESELAHAIVDAQSHGFEVAVHALGDRALDVALDGIRDGLRGGPNRWRHRIEHVTLARPDQLGRFHETGAIPVLFGAFGTCAFDGGGFGRADLLAETASYPWRWRDLLNANPGLPVAWASDWPVFTENPFVHLYGFATRRELAADGSVCQPEPEQANDTIPVASALRMMTMGSAYALGVESAVGSVKVGKLADLVVLSGDPLSIAPDAIPHLRVLATLVGGRTRFCAADAGPLCP